MGVKIAVKNWSKCLIHCLASTRHSPLSPPGWWLLLVYNVMKIHSQQTESIVASSNLLRCEKLNWRRNINFFFTSLCFGSLVRLSRIADVAYFFHWYDGRGGGGGTWMRRRHVSNFVLWEDKNMYVLRQSRKMYVWFSSNFILNCSRMWMMPFQWHLLQSK